MTDDELRKVADRYWNTPYPRASESGGKDWGSFYLHRQEYADMERLAETFAERFLTEPYWQPIDTAPKDGREILLCVAQRAGIPGKCLVGHWQPGGHCIEDHPEIDAGWYFWNGRMFDTAAKPTHWMPLPEPPHA